MKKYILAIAIVSLIIGSGVWAATYSNVDISINGIVKGDGTGTWTTAVSGTDYWNALTDITLANNQIFVGNASNNPVSVAMSNDCSIVANGTITCDHDALDNFLATEHVDWAGASAGTIHTDNYIEDVSHTNIVALNALFSSESVASTTWAGASSILTVGTLDSGAISANFGNIDIGGSNLDADGTITFNGTINFGGATSFEIPNGASPTVNAAGEMALDTTSNQLIIADSGNTARVYAVPDPSIFSVVIASTSPRIIAGTYLEIPKNIRWGRDITQFYCRVDGGTSVVVNVSDNGTNDTESITCDVDGQIDADVSTNSTFTAGEFWRIEFGTVTGEVNYLVFEAYGYITPN